MFSALYSQHRFVAYLAISLAISPAFNLISAYQILTFATVAPFYNGSPSFARCH